VQGGEDRFLIQGSSVMWDEVKEGWMSDVTGWRENKKRRNKMAKRLLAEPCFSTEIPTNCAEGRQRPSVVLLDK
jgi:hypothetical protein